MTGFWQAVLALSGWADPATLGLITKPLDCRLEGYNRICTFSSPGDILTRRHFRLETNCAGPVLVNGSAVARDETGWPISGTLRSDRRNEVTLPAGCPAPALLITPRVFAIVGRRQGNRYVTGVLLVNTLDNTTNVSLEVKLRGLSPFHWSGTLRPDEKRLIEFDSGERWETILLWKAPEAVEDGYNFRLVHPEPVL